uniref:Uncharacterized protein n=2 Tax=Ixodes scapularis TaxID=6945 RepID=A0A1S4L771_IXOSC
LLKTEKKNREGKWGAMRSACSTGVSYGRESNFKGFERSLLRRIGTCTGHALELEPRRRKGVCVKERGKGESPEFGTRIRMRKRVRERKRERG